MAKFKMTDKYIAFANAVAGGMEQWLAYLTHIASKPNCTRRSASVTASRLMTRGEMQEAVANARRARGEAITNVIARNIAAEFSTLHLTENELDSFHYAVIQGKIEVEEIVPQWAIQEQYDTDGKLIGKKRVQTFVRVKRPPNIREKQISTDAIYKRKGLYSRTGGGWRNPKDDDDVPDNVERVVMLSDGSTIPLLQ